MEYHTPVMVEEVIKYLHPDRGKNYIDATLGDGGHTINLLEKGAAVLGIDYNEESLNRASQRIQELGLAKNFTAVLGNFKNIENLAKEADFDEVNGIVFDLGFSSTELAGDLGLSFSQDQPLDMRIDENLGVTAADLVNTLPEKSLTRIFREYANERYARRFANAIIKARNLQKLQTTKQLAELLESAAPPDYERGRIHPATRVFQALRIVVNDEIENLRTALPRAARLLLPGGRLVVISFHSLEDKIVKNIDDYAQPVLKDISGGALTPSETEIKKNPRSRSAKLRAFKKVENEKR